MHTGVFAGDFYACAAKTKERQKDPSRALLEFCALKAGETEKYGSTGQLPLMPGAPRPGGRQDANQERHDFPPTPWTARGATETAQRSTPGPLNRYS